MTREKIAKTVCLVCALVCVTLTVIVAVQTVTYSGYESTEATVIRVWSTYDAGDHTGPKKHMIQCRYEVDGILYVAEQQVFSINGKMEGMQVTVSYDPADPHVCKNSLQYTTLLLADGALAAFTLLLFLLSRRKTR